MPNHIHGIVRIDNHVGNGFKPFPNDGNAQNISLTRFSDVKNNTQLFSKQSTELHTRDGNGFKPFPTDVKLYSRV